MNDSNSFHNYVFLILSVNKTCLLGLILCVYVQRCVHRPILFDFWHIGHSLAIARLAVCDVFDVRKKTSK